MCRSHRSRVLLSISKAGVTKTISQRKLWDKAKVYRGILQIKRGKSNNMRAS